MNQQSHNPLSFLKGSNASSTSLERSSSTRSRSGSLFRAIALHTSPSLSPQPPLPSSSSSAFSVSMTRTNTSSSTIHSTENDASQPISCNPEDFEFKDPIGYGSSAVVYHATFIPKNMRVAIKVIDLDWFERNQIDELRRETALMALSKHPNVLKVYGSFVNGSKLHIVTPYLSGGSCLDIMKSGFPDGFEETAIATILKQALEGLVYLHKNGHIHRDVKAGNLLVDDQGTVLLGDFGVSSSLTENNEVRKTFVGTPCWMAPEVMEQSGYDFKADIWSFGITALELATGYAPFAKFPPMKVLMMTLNQAPPTLDREHAKRKYTRTFKEMIDMCLNKNPSKRPSAEKLLAHPFFAQAKKKEYLVKALLSSVPPLDQRVHKKVNHKQAVVENTAQWDFEDQQSTLTQQQNDQEIVSLSNQKVNMVDKPTHLYARNNNTEGLLRQQHITFSDDLPSPAASEPEITSPMPIRKTRFVIEEHTSISPPDNLPASQRYSSASPPPYDVVPSFASTPMTPITSSSSYQSSKPFMDNNWQSSLVMGLGIASNKAENVEVRKGRFSVNQSNSLSRKNSTSVTDAAKLEQIPIQTPPPIPSSESYSSSDLRCVSMSRETSNDSLKERKSRFEVTSGSPNNQNPFENQHINRPELLPLTRESSFRHQRTLSRESFASSKIGRFSIEKEDNSTSQTEGVHPFDGAISASTDYRKKGRFELTGGTVSSEKFESPQATLSSSSQASSSIATPGATEHNHQRRSFYFEQQPISSTLSLYGQIDYLLQQNELQKQMLHEVLYELPSNQQHIPSVSSGRRRSSTADFRKHSNHAIDSSHLLYQPSSNENSR
ncbi:kinase-like domain-containing protein [Gilbertella persicaria]|uniref:kinase-like domain-containing protein n=1 Tax=Gilbertella persicaria TaxID=101096 RepID=UPI002220F6CA|nr:kinase-like domain-containing protein [Gilbertella persicaria]KAI8086865.1 kinase-like domain-containing protein [Gilbertella persicaria]